MTIKYSIPIIILTILTFSCKEQIEAEDSDDTSIDYTLVETAMVEVSNDPIPLYSIGRVDSDKDIKLSFKIGGVIMDVFADEGNYVKKGKLLAHLRTTEIDNQVFKAKRALSKAERDLDRTRSMFADSVATLENVQDLETLVEVSKSDVEIAEFNQNYAKIIAPENGRIIQKLAEANELAGPGQPIFVLASSKGASVVKASFSDKDIAAINYGDAADIVFDAFPGETFRGTVTQIAESSDPMTGTFFVDISVRSSKKRLRNGYVGRVSVLPKQTKSYYKIPIDAIVEGRDNNLVLFVPDKSDTIAHKLEVRPFKITSDYAAVYRTGIPEINEVITRGAPYLQSEDKIKIKHN